MSQNMEIEVNDGELHAKSITGQKQWVAVITDTHDKYNYDREFVAYQKPRTSNRDSGTVEIEDGAVIENVNYSHSGKTRHDHFYQVADGELHSIDESDVQDAIEEIIVDVDNDNEQDDTNTETMTNDNNNNNNDTERPATTLKEAGIDTDNDNNTDEEVVTDGGEEQSNNNVDVHAYDINESELEYEDSEQTNQIQSNGYKLREIKDSDGIYVAYHNKSGLLGIGRLQIDLPELNTENIEQYVRDEAENERGNEYVNSDVILNNAAEIAATLKSNWEETTEYEINEAISKAGTGSSAIVAGFDGSSIYTSTHNPLSIEADEVSDEYDAGQEGGYVLKLALEKEVENNCKDSWGDADYFAGIEMEIESWELRALELQQNAGFPRKMSQTVAVNEEESMKRDVAERLGVSSSTVTEHLQNAAERVEEAQWTVRNVDL